jgi:hypothetical protein
VSWGILYPKDHVRSAASRIAYSWKTIFVNIAVLKPCTLNLNIIGTNQMLYSKTIAQNKALIRLD